MPKNNDPLPKLLTTQNILFALLMFVIIYMIYRTYQTDLTKRTYLINLYLYIFFTLFAIMWASSIFKNYINIDGNKIWMFIVGYLIISLLSLSLIFNSNIYVSHAGLLLFIFAQAFLLSIPFKYANNVKEALVIAGGIFLLFTALAFYASDNMLLTMANWLPGLTLSLCCIIVIYIIALIFFNNDQFYRYFKYINYAILIVFIFLVLSDTSVQIIKTKNLNGQTQKEMNYPANSIGLSLDFINIFLSVLNLG